MSVPLCRDCTYCRPSVRTHRTRVWFRVRVEHEVVYAYAHCAHPSSARTEAVVDLVTGERTPPEIGFCSVARMRHNEKSCGAEGRFFQRGPNNISNT